MTSMPSPEQLDIGPERSDSNRELQEMIERWKAKVDELRVQIDLAKMDFRDRVDEQLRTAGEAEFVADAKLRVAWRDAVANTEMLRNSIRDLLHDVKDALDSVDAVVSRSP